LNGLAIFVDGALALAGGIKDLASMMWLQTSVQRIAITMRASRNSLAADW